MYASLHEINSLNVNVNLSIVLLQCLYVHFNTLKADFCLRKPHRTHFTVLGANITRSFPLNITYPSLMMHGSMASYHGLSP